MYIFCPPRNRPGGLLTFHQPVWPLLLYGHLWYSGLSAYTCRGGEGKKYMDNTHSPKLGENSQPALNRLFLGR